MDLLTVEMEFDKFFQTDNFLILKDNKNLKIGDSSLFQSNPIKIYILIKNNS